MDFMASDPSTRALELLSVLQRGGEWTAAVLAARLGVSTRTVRRDVERLRRLGYRVDSRPGPSSAYRLRAGRSVPPLLFTADEVAILVAGVRLIAPRLASAESAGGADRADDADSALAKLENVLSPALRQRAHAMDLATEVLDDAHGVSVQVVGALADAVAESGRVRFGYRDRNDAASVRTVDPYRHVYRAGHWYLVGFDLDRDEWRTYRMDRIGSVERIPGTYRRRDLPGESLGRWFDTDFGRGRDSSNQDAGHRDPGHQ